VSARFLCAGDLHLDVGADLGASPGDRLREQETVWQHVFEIAVENDVDAILFAGDAFHKARPTPEAMLAFERPLKRFPRYHGAGCIAIPGNHDVASVQGGTGLEIFHIAGMLRLVTVPELDGAMPKVGDVTICALPWASVSSIVAAAGGGDRDDLNAYAAELLLATARGLRERADGPAILLTHFSISGSSLPSGLPVEELREPVLDQDALDRIGFDAVVAGHIHMPQVFGRDTLTSQFYVGSPMPLNFGEARYDHGVFILECDDAVSGVWTPRFVPISSRRLVTLDAVDSVLIEREVVEGAIVKVRLRATQEAARKIDVAQIKRALLNAGAHKVWAVQLEIAKPERARVEGLDEELDELAALDLWLDAQGVNGDHAAALRERTERYLGAVRT
jgi:exonuclease SbcD